MNRKIRNLACATFLAGAMAGVWAVKFSGFLGACVCILILCVIMVLDASQFDPSKE